MGFDRRYKKDVSTPGIHPVWRGIGCVLLILIPLISLAAADVIINSNLDVIAIPNILRATVDTGILGVVYYFPAKVLLGLVITVALFALVSITYSVIYSASGANKRGPMDAPPIRKRVKKRDL